MILDSCHHAFTLLINLLRKPKTDEPNLLVDVTRKTNQHALNGPMPEPFDIAK